MKDSHAYINSGILELYVLGSLDAPGRREVEQYANDYPEIAAAIQEIEITLEGLAINQSIPPDTQILDRLLSSIAADSAAPGSAPSSPELRETSRNGTAPATAPKTAWLPWLLAGLLLLGLLYLVFSNGTKNARISALDGELSTLREACAEDRAALAAAQQKLRLVAAAGTRDVLLAGTDNAPDSRALVFYNADERQTFFRASNLPPPPSGRQYQLWAINADGPQSLGVLELDLDGDTIKTVDYVAGAATFAITLEPEGGLPSPTLENLQVIGNLEG